MADMRKARGVLKGAARPGSRNNNTKGAAGAVGSVNGRVARPGYKQGGSRYKGGGTGSIARPGFAQGIHR